MASLQGDGDERHGLDSVPTLTRLCQAAVRKGVTVETVCSALTMVDLLQPVLDEVAPTLIGFLARNLENVLKLDPKGFEAMPASLLAEMLGNPCLVRPAPSHDQFMIKCLHPLRAANKASSFPHFPVTSGHSISISTAPSVKAFQW